MRGIGARAITSRLEPTVQLPGVPQVIGRPPDARAEPGQERRTQGGRLDDLRSLDRHAHLVRATLEAIAFEVRDVLETMPGDVDTPLRVDGGASANDLLCQIQADQVGRVVQRPRLVETTGLGAAFLAGLGVGVWDSTDDLRATWQLDRSFDPAADRTKADAAHTLWLKGVERSKDWA